MGVPEFREWPKTARLFREAVITEKIDGTNACVIIGEDDSVTAQSRSRIITSEQDNFGFARWVSTNADALAADLGPGYHYGEWWGSGIQRGYGLVKGEKRFSLFNQPRWADLASNVPGLGVVPLLHAGDFSTLMVEKCVDDLRHAGSCAAPGFMKPEGVIVWHAAARVAFKVTLEKDEQPKAQASA